LCAILACVQAMSPVEQSTAAPVSELAASLYAIVVFMHKACNADFFEAITELELSLTQIKVLHHLESTDSDLTLKDLAELIPVSLPAASRTVDDLVRRGFVVRNEDTIDRRMKRVRITETGLAVTRRLNAARLSGLQQFTETLNPDEQASLTHALSVLVARPDIAACRPEGVQA
jgi:DNA-binding MarR family transcriptional regulator